VIELPTGKSGSTMEGSTGKATNMTTAHATHMRAESAHMTAKPATSHVAPAGEPATAATTDWRESHNATASNVLGDQARLLPLELDPSIKQGRSRLPASAVTAARLIRITFLLF